MIIIHFAQINSQFLKLSMKRMSQTGKFRKSRMLELSSKDNS